MINLINIIINIKFKKRLNIENKISYENEIKDGLFEILFLNKSKILNYKIKNSLDFFTDDKKTFNGSLEFKPFYLQAELDYKGISTKDVLNKNSVIVDLIKSEIFHNENLNVNIKLSVEDIINIDELNNLILNMGLEQGDITLTNSRIMWK